MSKRFEDDLRVLFGERMKDDAFAARMWSAMANVDWYHLASKEPVAYSFRAAGGLIADIRGEGDYMDWYCSGPYETVSDEIARAMKKRGWVYWTSSDRRGLHAKQRAEQP